MDCTHCDIGFKQQTSEDVNGENEKYYSLTIKSGTLARLMQRQHLNIADLHCMNADTKQFIQSVLLQCILCKTVQNQSSIQHQKTKLA